MHLLRSGPYVAPMDVSRNAAQSQTLIAAPSRKQLLLLANLTRTRKAKDQIGRVSTLQAEPQGAFGIRLSLCPRQWFARRCSRPWRRYRTRKLLATPSNRFGGQSCSAQAPARVWPAAEGVQAWMPIPLPTPNVRTKPTSFCGMGCRPKLRATFPAIVHP